MNEKRGYTLIEILVSLTIIGLVFAYGFISFRDFSRRQALLSTTRNLEGEIRLAQELALSGKKPAGCGVLDGYRVKFFATEYDIVAVCNAAEISVGKDAVSLGESVTLSATSSFVTFKVLGLGTDIDTSEVTITLTQSETGNTQMIVISASGEII